MKDKNLLLCGAVVGLSLVQPVLAQPAAVEWSSVAKITNGTCGDNATAYVTERPGKMHLRLVYRNGQQYADFDVTLAADGSGKSEFKGNAGAPVTLEIPAGSGKRPMKTSQASTGCQWAWTPK